MKLNVKGSELKMQGFKEFLVDAYGFTDNSSDHNKVAVKTFNKTIEPCYEVGTGYFNVVEDAETLDILIKSYLGKGVIDKMVNYVTTPEQMKNYDYNPERLDLSKTQPENFASANSYWGGFNYSDEGLKESEGKTPYEELDWDYVDSMAHRMESNDKYPPENWKKEMDIRKLAASAIRHARAILEPSEYDTESQEDHAVALGCNGMMINYQLK